ncbi:mannose-1-phosphate guanylyltransferase [Hyphobacterium sp. CCMP332]|nr:mannose-1-phosphate guanylyltransferase [Hyphobacterium sp. CCMP332]
MAGGVGSRFWPFSRSKEPKQFLDILGTGKTLIQQTIDRFDGIIPRENIYVVTNEDYKEIVKSQLRFLKDDQILLEPVGRNTAPCIAYGVSKISTLNQQANIIVCPSDHVILDTTEFQRVINEGMNYVSNNDSLLTLGIHPSRPDTGYGYIQFHHDENTIKKVKTFTEKPDADLAKTFVESGDFLWNSGIFIWNINSIESALEKYLPEVSELFFSDKTKYYTKNENDFIRSVYSQCRNISIDYGIMEKASNVYVFPSDFGWTDLGTWKSLFETKKKDDNKNVIDGKVLLNETNNCIIKSDGDKLMVVDGLDNYIVVQHGDVVMICRKEYEQQVKNFVTDIKQNKDLSKFI